MSGTTERKSASGSCLCGTIRFRIEFPTRFCAHCHCPNCRRAHGAAFVTWVGVPREQIDVEGRPSHYRTDTDATRTFCGTCGTTLFYEGPRWPDEVHVTRASIDGDIDRAPAGHVYVDHAAAWWTIDDDLPRYGGASGTEKVDRKG